MREGHPIMLSLVERGWQAARECSLDAQRQGVRTVHLIKGWVHPRVLALHRSSEYVRMISVPRPLFWVAVGCALVWWGGSGVLRAVLVDHERSAARLHRWIGWLHAHLMMVRMGDAGYELWAGEQRISPITWDWTANR